MFIFSILLILINRKDISLYRIINSIFNIIDELNINRGEKQ
jgi:hypothetical protein